MNLITAYANPDRHVKKIPSHKLIADSKVDWSGVYRYKEKIKDGGDVRPIVVIRHPKKDVYAVLDGHHRFWAQKEMNINRIDCVIVNDDTGVFFNLTKEGVFQPSPEITRYVRIPLKRALRYIDEFINCPERMLEFQNRIV